MPKSASVYTRVEPEIKVQAEQILSKLGIPMANAINLFLHQVVLRKGIPFTVSLPQSLPINYYTLSADQFNVEIEKGFKFEETGTYTSQTFKNLINRFRPTKK